MNNDNKKISRNRKRRIEQKIKMDDNMKSFINKIKTEKKKKTKNFDKIENLEIELVKINYVSNPSRLKPALKELNEFQVVSKSLHEIKQKILLDHISEFEMAGSLKAGDQNRQNQIRFRNTADYEAYIIPIDQD